MALTSHLAWDNQVRTATLTAGSAAAGMDASQLRNDHGTPVYAWQTAAGVTTAAAGAWVRAEFAQPTPIRAFALARTNLTPSATVRFSCGVVSFSGDVESWTSGTIPGPAPSYGQIVAVAASAWVVDYVYVEISDPTNPDGFVNVPLFFAGDTWQPARGFSWSSSYGRDSQTIVRTSRGGQEYPAPLYQQRRFELRLEGVRADEQWAKLDALARAAGQGANVLVIPDASSSYIRQDAILGTCRTTADVTFSSQAGDARSWAARITERL